VGGGWWVVGGQTEHEMDAVALISCIKQEAVLGGDLEEAVNKHITSTLLIKISSGTRLEG